jgi:3-phytase
MLEIVPTADGHLSYRRHRTITLPTTFRLPGRTSWTPCSEADDEFPQAEAMVVDQVFGLLYVAQEDVGIWRLALWERKTDARLIDKVREFGVPYDRTPNPEDPEEFTCTIRPELDPGFGGKHLSADVEGLTIYYADDRSDEGYLLASSQGDSTFAVYRREKEPADDFNKFLGSIRLIDTSATDGVQESDGAAVINVPLGHRFPLGLLVVHDGSNKPDMLNADGEVRANTNFKLVPWPNVAAAFQQPLLINPHGFNPRTSCGRSR